MDEQAVWLSPQEAAHRLGVSSSTLRRWEEAGRIRSWRTPTGHRRFAVTEVERLIADGAA